MYSGRNLIDSACPLSRPNFHTAAEKAAVWLRGGRCARRSQPLEAAPKSSARDGRRRTLHAFG